MKHARLMFSRSTLMGLAQRLVPRFHLHCFTRAPGLLFIVAWLRSRPAIPSDPLLPTKVFRAGSRATVPQSPVIKVRALASFPLKLDCCSDYSTEGRELISWREVSGASLSLGWFCGILPAHDIPTGDGPAMVARLTRC